MSQWADNHIAALQEGETITCRPKGHSMTGYIKSGQLCHIEPAPGALEVGDIVLCTVKGKQYLHRIGALKHLKGQPSTRYRIENAKGHVNGWIPRHAIHGIYREQA